jgi:superfamily II DNA or RNA helicase
MPRHATDLYDEAAVERRFGSGTLRKAQGYISAVADLEIAPERIAAKVKGSAPRPYRVTVHVGKDLAGRPYLEPSCTCPVGYLCKHAAAVLIAARVWEAKRRAGGVPEVNPALLAWLDKLRVLRGKASAVPRRRTPTHCLLYSIQVTEDDDQPAIGMHKARLNKLGTIAAVEGWDNVERALLAPPSFVGAEDEAILRQLWPLRAHAGYWSEYRYPAQGPRGAEALRLIAATGRLYLGNPDRGKRLQQGATRSAALMWRPVADTPEVGLRLESQPPASGILPCQPLWYVDAEREEAGELTVPCDHALAVALLEMPALGEADVAVAAAALAELAPELPAPPAEATLGLATLDVAPRPLLSLSAVPFFRGYSVDFGAFAPLQFDYGAPGFDYQGIRVAPGEDREFRRMEDGSLLRLKRRTAEEASWLAMLTRHGLRELKGPMRRGLDAAGLPDAAYAPADPQGWRRFVAEGLPALRAAGWQIEVSPKFQYLVVEPEAWVGELAETQDQGYALELGIVVDGRTVSLTPLLAELFERDHRWLHGQALDKIADDEPIALRTADGGGLRVRAQRLKPLVRNLIDLFDAQPGAERLKLSRLDTARLDALAGSWQFAGADGLRGFAQRLRDGGLAQVAPPAGLKATLRAYQAQGLAWLQLLRTEGLAGVLADDMGLGKTVQALAHLLLEKESGRLDRPALVVCPTSLLHNWRDEAQHFAPALSVLTLHGPQRAELFDSVPRHDLVLTSYPLLWRDVDQLAAHEFSFVILDEAQMVKNAASRGAAAVRKLRSRHRLALTGTPLENHLGELWTLFDFLLPGFLGTREDFTRRFRTPIEKQGDIVRSELLARRVKPFLLRRRKEDVARELPPKSVMVREVALEGGQRDLYETVRAAMQAKVSALLAGKGLNRSHIEVLDALLKLRQVCCDPRLLKLPQAQRVKESAKLQLLAQMLPELAEEGRRVLVFSAFAEMLALIAGELDRLELAYVTLTGQTKDRAGVVKRFQSGQVPVFLISLKAGGVGLNLTAADTVIHYDPWWNPAAEDQATDRAHRIGQDKPVFVYKLVAAGSIEDKILALQERKAGIARGVLGEAEAGKLEFTEADIAALLAPLAGG